MMTDSQGQINTFRHLNTKTIKVPQSSHVIQKKKKKTPICKKFLLWKTQNLHAW